jgi:gamma-glutamyltranspeptidase/glutathione hydrolase
MLPAGVAAGHPATVDAGIAVLEAGGSAADAAVAASLASCVAETVMTGLLGGGHAIYFDAASGQASNLDCFVAVPGLGGEWRAPELEFLPVPFGEELVHYAVGPASCGVPGLPAGLHALWERFGRLPWTEVVAPACSLAREGVVLPPAHATCLAMLAPVMTMNEGAQIYAPAGRLLEAGELLHQPGLERALKIVSAEGARTAYDGALGDALLSLVRERGGTITRDDLTRYEPRWEAPVELGYAGTRLATRGGLAEVAEIFPQLPRLQELPEGERVLALVDALLWTADRAGDTTNLVTADDAGNACVLTTSLGLGSGDFLPGLDLHLNSMLGEADLVRGPLTPGERMQSMMAPTLAFDAETLVLAAGAAGGTRLRTALSTVVAGVLDEGRSAQEAVDRPRVHPAAGVVNAEPGVDEAALEELERRGLAVRRWPARHHYFGGVSLITRSGGAGDPRRSGSARRLRAES